MSQNELINYLTDKINNSWYAETKRVYGVSGEVKNIKMTNETLTIQWKESGQSETRTLDIHYPLDYTKEQIYNIWMENV